MKSDKSKAKEKTKFNKNTRYLILTGIIVLLIAVFSIISPTFFTLNTFMNIIRQNVSLALLALGTTFIIMLAGTDLSAGSNVAFAGACGALAIQAMGGDGVAAALVGIVVTILAGTLVGAVNGFMVGKLNINPFMATLAMMSLARGMTLFLTNSRRVVVENDIYNWFGQEDVFGVVPASLVLLAVVFIVAHLVLTKTTYGRTTYAVGGNPVAARASGIKAQWHTMKVFMYAGAFAGLSAIVTVGRATSAQPLAGVGMEFDAITAAVIGGTSLAGGVGSLVGTLLGTLIIGIIFTGLGMVQISAYYTYVVKGLLIILAVYMDQVANRGRVKKMKAMHAEKVEAGSLHKVMEMVKKPGPKTLELRNIYKSFPGVKALQDVSFTIKSGSVHALVGENGAGKSTLMKILSGVYTKDDGEILVDGVPVNIKSPVDSQKIGISVIYQEFALVPELNVTQNIFMGKELKKGFLLNAKQMGSKAKALLERFKLNIGIQRRVTDCTVGQQQMIEIAKAVGSDAWVVVMDEPTSAITEAEKERLFEIIQELKAQNIAVVYISHRMPEIFEIADEVTVLRDGQHVMTAPVSEVSEGDLIKSMVGRELTDVFNRDKFEPGKVVLEVKNLERKGVFEPISFTVREGEVLGLSGLMGAGRTEIARCIFGLDKPDGGQIYLNGEKLSIHQPLDAIKAGIGYVSEDRRREGIVPLMSVRENITLALLPWINKAGWIDAAKDREVAAEYIERLNIKTPSPEQQIGNLSGGNQQKGCLGKWLSCQPKLIIMDEPTRGIDVGAKAEIHKLIEQLCKEKMAVIMISSELPEILGSSDRIMVLYEGKLTATYDSVEGLDQETIMTAAAGI